MQRRNIVVNGNGEPEISGYSISADDEEMIGAAARPNVRQRPPKQPDVNISPSGGQGPQKGMPATRPTIMEKAIDQWQGMIAALTEGDNQLDTVGHLLIVNTANVLTKVFQAEVPRNRKWHFRPQFVKYRDANITSYLIQLKDASTTPAFISGTYMIIATNSNETKIRGVLGSGSLEAFGIGVNAEASLCDIQRRIYYIEELWLEEGDLIQLKVKSGTVLTPANSKVTLQFMEYTP